MTVIGHNESIDRVVVMVQCNLRGDALRSTTVKRKNYSEGIYIQCYKYDADLNLQINKPEPCRGLRFACSAAMPGLRYAIHRCNQPCHAERGRQRTSLKEQDRRENISKCFLWIQQMT